MRRFECRRCGRRISAQPEEYVAPPVLQRERMPVCCGLEMVELMDL